MPILGSGNVNSGTGTVTFTDLSLSTGISTTTSASASASSQTYSTILSQITSVSAANLGSGTGIFSGATGISPDVTLYLKSIIGGVGISVSTDAETITLSATGASSQLKFINLIDGPMHFVANAVLVGNATALAWSPSANIANTVLTFNGTGFVWTAAPPPSLTSIAVTQGVATVANVVNGVVTMKSLVAGNGINITANASNVLISAIPPLPTPVIVGDGHVVVSNAIANTISLALSNTGVTVGTFAFPTVSVDAQGRVDSISDGSGALANAITSALSPFSNTVQVLSDIANAIGNALTPYANSLQVTTEITGAISNALSSYSNSIQVANAISTALSGQIANVTGDVTGSGLLSNIAVHLINNGVIPGTYTNVTVDSTGRVTNVSNLTANIITSILGYTPLANAYPLTANAIDAALGYTPLQNAYTLTANAISTALGYVPLQNAYVLTANAIDTALGYTPLQNSAVTSVAGRTGNVVLSVTDIANAAPLLSPSLSGVPTAPTANASDSSNTIATTAFVHELVSNAAYTLTANSIDAALGYTPLQNAYVLTANAIDTALGFTPLQNAVTSVTITGNGINITNATVTNSGIIGLSLANTGVIAGSYTLTSITVDAFGRVTSIANGTVASSYVLTANAIDAALGYIPLQNAYTLTANAIDAALGFTPISNAVTSVTISGSGITVTNPTITNSGTIALSIANTGVAVGTYTSPTLVVEADGRITAIANGVGSSGSANGVTSITIVGTGIDVTNPTVTSVGVVSLSLSNTGVTPGSYNITSITVGSDGRITAIGNGTSYVLTANAIDAALGYTPLQNAYVLTANAIDSALGYTPLQNAYTLTANAIDAALGFTPISNAVTNVTISGTGINVSNPTITNSGTISLSIANTGVTVGTYSIPILVVEADGRITSIANGTAGGTGTVTSVTIAGNGINVTNPTVTGSGTISLALSNTGVTAGSFNLASVTVGVDGRVTAITNGSLTANAIDSALGYTPLQNAVTTFTVTGNGINVTNPTISSTGTVALSLANTGVTVGTYSIPTVVVDATGRITSIANGTSGGTGTVTSVTIAGTGINVTNPTVTSAGTISLALSNTGVTAGSFSLASVTVGIDGRVTAIAAGSLTAAAIDAALGFVPLQNAVTSFTVTGTGINVANPTITSNGTVVLSLANTGVSAGSYSLTSITVGADGRIIAIANGTAGSAGSNGTVTSVTIAGDGNINVTNPTITSNGTISLSLSNTGVTAGTYSSASIVVTPDGRIISASNTVGGSSSVTLTGDVTGTGTGTIATTLANSGVTAGTYSFATVTVNAKGIVTHVVAGTSSGGSSIPAGFSFSAQLDPSNGGLLAGGVGNSSAFTNIPSGWTIIETSISQITITHNLNRFPYSVSSVAPNGTYGNVLKYPSGNPTAYSTAATANSVTIYGISTSALGTATAGSIATFNIFI